MRKIHKRYIDAYNSLVRDLIKDSFVENKLFNIYRTNKENKRICLFSGRKLCARDGKLYYADYLSKTNTVELVEITDIRSVMSALMCDKVEYEYCNFTKGEYVLDEEDRHKLSLLIALGFEKIEEIKRVSIYSNHTIYSVEYRYTIVVTNELNFKSEVQFSNSFVDKMVKHEIINGNKYIEHHDLEYWYNLQKPVKVVLNGEEI